METINILPEGFKPLPFIFHTASSYYRQTTMVYPEGKQTFYQILFILNGKGTLYCNGETHKLKRGSAFFTSLNIESKYVDEGNLYSAFLTVESSAMPMVLEHFGIKDFLFYDNINLDKYISYINQITDEYYKTKNESVISALIYSFYVSFFNEQLGEKLPSLDKTALYIEKNFTQKLTLPEIAKINETSVSKLCHDFKKKYGLSVFSYIINLRLNYANNLISKRPSLKIKEISALSGFDDVSYFCKLYKEKFGHSPSESKNPP